MVAGRGFAAREVARKHGWHAQGAALRSRGRGRAATARGLTCVLLACAACSPTAFAVRQRAAARAVAEAEAAGAQSYATYELVLARRYLDKAREESGEAHYAWALELLTKSERSAARARALSAELRVRERASAGRASTAGPMPEPVAGTVQGNLR